MTATTSSSTWAIRTAISRAVTPSGRSSCPTRTTSSATDANPRFWPGPAGVHGSDRRDGVQGPLAGNALELVRAALGELDSRPTTRSRRSTTPGPPPARPARRSGRRCGRPCHRRRSRSPRPRRCGGRCAARSRVAHPLADRLGAADRPGRTVEGGEEAVPGRLDRPAAVGVTSSRVRRSWRSRVSRHRRSPSSAANSVEPTMSVNMTVASARSIATLGHGSGRELLDRVHVLLESFAERDRVPSRQLEERRLRDVLGEVPGMAGVHHPGDRPVDDHVGVWTRGRIGRTSIFAPRHPFLRRAGPG